MRHLVLTGACYLDTILNVPYFPEEDAKLRATGLQVRRGGNCGNSLEVLQEVMRGEGGGGGHGKEQRVLAYLVACLPAADAAATQTMLRGWESEGESHGTRLRLRLDTCLYRPGHEQPASCYILRSAASASRTIVSHNGLPEMTADEFASVAEGVAGADETGQADPWWWHFEGRVPETTGACIQWLRQRRRGTVSVEVENPARSGLRALAAAADVVFYSRTWAEHQGYTSAEACLRGEWARMPQVSLMFCTWGAQGAAALAASPASTAALSASTAAPPAPPTASTVSTASAPTTFPRLFISPVPLPLPASQVIDPVGAGDTFMAGVFYMLACGGADRRAAAFPASPTPPPASPVPLATLLRDDATVQATLAFAVGLATRKVQQDGFQGLAAAAQDLLQDRQTQ